MKAALLTAPGEIEIGEIPDPEPGPGDVRVAVGGVGLCGSDLSVFSGRWTAPSYPWVMGHEAFGTIEAVGPGVPPERVGQTVVIEPNAACFSCNQCERGWTSVCGGRKSVGMNRPGALAELLVVPSRFAWSIAEAPATDLVCVEPMTVVRAALRRLVSPLPDDALVVGMGAQGMMMALVLLERGVSVYANDVLPERVEFATELGARPEPEDGAFGLVIDTVGSPASMSAALASVDFGGTVLALGLDGRPLDLNSQQLVRKQLILQGSLTYDHPADFAASVEIIAQGRFSPGRVVTDEYRLDEALAAFDKSPRAPGKTWIRVSG